MSTTNVVVNICDMTDAEINGEAAKRILGGDSCHGFELRHFLLLRSNWKKSGRDLVEFKSLMLNGGRKAVESRLYG